MLLANWLLGLCRRKLHRRGNAIRRSRAELRKREWGSRWLGNFVEPLETRLLLSQAALSGGSLIVTGAGSDNDAITVTLGTTTITFNDPNNTIAAGSGVTQVDTHTVTVP